jgi:glutathione S-transferase
MAGGLILYVCSLDDGGPRRHACRRAHEALRAAGHEYETVVFDRNHPFGLFTRGRRPELRRISGQEKLPVLKLPSRGAVVHSAAEIEVWARTHTPATATRPATANPQRANASG